MTAITFLRPCALVLISLCASVSAQAASFTFNSDPFAGTTALTTPGRQIVGGEPSINFLVATDVFVFDRSIFNVGNSISFANNIAASLPTSGANVMVLRSFDDDANTATPFAAGNAANLIAAQVTTSGAGFFIYFNQGLDLARLVYSTDLSKNTADLKILARMTNISGQAGKDAFPQFTASNFALTAAVPEPSPSRCWPGIVAARRAPPSPLRPRPR